MRVCIRLCVAFTVLLVSMVGLHVKSSAFDPLFWPARIDYGAGTRSRSVFGAVLDSDGDTDLALANFGSNDVSILLNTTNPPGIQEKQEARSQRQETRLFQNQPNPFWEFTIIDYHLPGSERTRLAIFDVSGRLVRVLVNQQQRAGDYSLRWDGKDVAGETVTAGIYFCRLEAGSFTRTNKMVVLR